MPLEIKNREIDPRLYLALEITAKGLPCIFGIKTGVHRMMERYPRPYAYVAKHLDPEWEERYQMLAKQGGFVAFLDEEGGIYPRSHFEPFVLLRYPPKILDHIGLFCPWGQKQKEVVVKGCDGVKQDRFVVGGHPKFDLSKPHFAEYFEAARNKHPLRDQPYILFNTSFAIGNHRTPYDVVRQSFAKWISNGWEFYEDIEAFDEHWHHHHGNLQGFLTAIRAVSRHFSNTPILVRAHPIENIEIYESTFADLPNVTVRRVGAVQEDICGASAVIHHDCTSAIEALLFGHSVISYAPNGYHERCQFLPVEISESTSTTKDLITAIAVRLDGDGKGTEDRNAANREKLRPYVANVDFSSGERIASAIQKRSKGCKSDPTGLRVSPLRRTTEAWVQGAKSRVKYLLSGAENRALAANSRAKFPGLKLPEITSRIAAFRKAVPSLPEVEVQPLLDSTFLLTRVD